MLNFEIPDGSPELATARQRIREFLEAERAQGSWAAPDKVNQQTSLEFTRRLGQAGYIGMTWPRRYGGGERSYLERYVVTEELLAAGAPVRAHWVTDRQIGPLLVKFGSDRQKEKFLPRMARGESFFAVGLSESEAGSDLSALKTRATRDAGGWRIKGSKVWTSNAHQCDHLIVLCRTSSDASDRRVGLTQFIVPTDADGVRISPILNMADEHDFNEVFLDDVWVGDEALLGSEDHGWSQVSAELAYERSGPERWLSAFRLLAEAVEALGPDLSNASMARLGALMAHLASLRQMSFSIASMLEGGAELGAEAAMVKDLGTNFEQRMVKEVRDLLHAEGVAVERESRLERLLHSAQVWSLIYTVRGGAKEIMRGVIARNLGLR